MALADIPYLTATWTAPASDLTDYAGYFDLANAPQGWWDEVDTSDGTKMRVAKDDDAEGATTATELAFEVVDFDNVAQTGQLWFRWSGTLPAISPNDVRIYPAKASATSYGTTDTFGRNAVWVNEERASHNGADEDVTGNGNAGTAGAGITAGGVAGKIGDATDYAFDGDGVSGTNPITLTNDFTVRAWVNHDSITSFADALGFGGSNFLAIGATSTGDFKITSAGETPGSGSALTVGTWYLMAMRYNATTGDIDAILNGAIDYTLTPSGTSWQSSTSFTLNISDFDGKIDEDRYTQSFISIDYLALEYDNQNDPATFWSSITLDNASTGDQTISLSDSITITDSLNSASNEFTVSDTIGYNDNANFNIKLLLADSISYADSLNSIANAFALSDTISITDSISVTKSTFIQLSDSIGFTDSIKALEAMVEVSDSIGFNDSLASIGAQMRVTDSISISDSLQQLNVEVTLSDSVSFTDSILVKKRSDARKVTLEAKKLYSILTKAKELYKINLDAEERID